MNDATPWQVPYFERLSPSEARDAQQHRTLRRDKSCHSVLIPSDVMRKPVSRRFDEDAKPVRKVEGQSFLRQNVLLELLSVRKTSVDEAG